MGGKAAKERRRLQRQAAFGDGSGDNKEQPTDAEPKFNPSNRKENGNRLQKKDRKQLNQSRSKPSSSSRPSFKQGAPRNSSRPNHQQRQSPTIADKTKVKKPKHLKRKLERVGDDDEREKLVSALKQWEEKKKSVSQSQKHKRPRISALSHQTIQEKQVQSVVEPLKKDALNPITTDAPEPQEVASLERSKEADKPVEAAVSMKETDASEEKQTHTVMMQKHEDSSSDSDSDVSLEETTKRTRGRRRRRRKSNEPQPEASDNENEAVANKDATDRGSLMEVKTPVEIPEDASDTAKDSEKAPKKNDSRRCIGRKPVSDFVVGQRYSGKVIYTKDFGAFIDIGCHSDAFCHVSRVRDDFVDSIGDVLSIGDEVSARVVEVDRRAKRITVSLQSDARIEDERASVKARLHRKEKRGSKTKHSTTSTSVAIGNEMFVATPRKEEEPAERVTDQPVDESMMSPTELKRTRKLARRAARREQQSATGIAA